MKFLRGAVLALVVTLSSCNNYQQTKLESEMEKPGVIEVVMFKANENIKPEAAQKELIRLNDFVASEKAMQDPDVAEIFNVIHQDVMLIKHYKVFHGK